MAQHLVELVATEGVFIGLAKQNMLFHQCISELIDNSIASTRHNDKFRIEIIFEENPKSEESIGVYIVDNGIGMTLDTLKDALQLGRKPPEESNRLHEHGFGLKNALATLTRGRGYWKLWTKDDNERISSVSGPFGPTMTLEDNDDFPKKDFLPSDISTLIYVETPIDFIRTVQGRGRTTNNLKTLRTWLIEHLGVLYRGYLEQDKVNFEESGTIIVSIGKDRKKVNPINVPIGNAQVEYIKIELGGETYQLEYIFGTLDEVKRDQLVSGTATKYYYLKNIPTQGIDIRLGKRTIATSLLETIWTSTNGTSRLSRHNDYNDFVGELRIPELPRGILTTVNNKTDFNLDDPDWHLIFDELNKFKPPKRVREQTEEGLRKKWEKMLRATNPEDKVVPKYVTWPTGVEIDVFREKENNDIIIYELKVGQAVPINLYQLMMYWDGLEIEGKIPKEAVLLVESYSDGIENMVNIINTELKTPNSGSYNFKLETHSNKNL